jgi:hypothetical protein
MFKSDQSYMLSLADLRSVEVDIKQVAGAKASDGEAWLVKERTVNRSVVAHRRPQWQRVRKTLDTNDSPGRWSGMRLYSLLARIDSVHMLDSPD